MTELLGVDTYDMLGGLAMDETRDYHGEQAARVIELEAEVISLRRQLELALVEIENFRKRAIGLSPTPEPSFREIKTGISPAVVGFGSAVASSIVYHNIREVS